MNATPEHVLWAIQCECPFRNSANWTAPEQTARELRPLRAYSEAVIEGRVFEGICVDRLLSEQEAAPPLGFPIAEVFNMYGDRALVEETCRQCAANDADESSSSLAGCHGWFTVSDLKAPLNERLQSDAGNELFSVGKRAVKERFYGVWMRPDWQGPRLSNAVELFSTVIRDANLNDSRLLRFVSALGRAADHELTMRVKLMPPGRLDGRWWYVVRHCPHCRAEWSSTVLQCRVCGFDGNPLPPRKRHAKGTRPFVPLEKILGDVNVGSFLRRYAERENTTLAAQKPSVKPAELYPP